MKRETCIFYASWLDALDEVPEAVRGEALWAILSYALRGELAGKQGPLTRAMMAMVVPVIDTNNRRYENGCKGGRPSDKKNQTETKPKPNRNQTETYNVNVNDNVNDNVFFNSGLTAAERKKIFEIFYFHKNMIEAKEEVERFANHYEAVGWRRGASAQPVRNKVALAKSWEPKNKAPRVPAEFLTWWRELYAAVEKQQGDVSLLINELYRVEFDKAKLCYRLHVSRANYELIERAQCGIRRNFEMVYSVPKLCK